MGRHHIRDTTFLPRCSAAQGGAGGDALPQPGRDRPPGRQDPSGLPGAGVRRRLRRLRIGELAALRRSRVDFATGIVDVAETVNELKGKLVVGPPKTRASRRKVSLPLGVMEELADHLRRRAGPPIRYSRRGVAASSASPTSAARSGGPRWPSYPRPSAYGFPEADTALRAWLDAMVRGATEHRRNAVG
jgi:integrase